MKTLNDLTVLLVEPSVPQSKFISNQLREAGIEHIEYVETGSEALQHMKTRHCDLTISAMYLSDMTCIDLVEKMRSDDDLMDIAYILISSETHEEFLDPVMQAGVTAILPKPFDPMQLRRALYNTLDYLDPDELHLENYSADELQVLIVDDSPFSRKQMRRVLNEMGVVNIMEAEDGGSAIPIIDKHYFDLIVTDYNMPVVDGKGLIDYIRNESNQPSVPLLMVTSEGNESVLSTIQQSGVSAICNKPFEVNTIKSTIETIMSEV